MIDPMKKKLYKFEKSKNQKPERVKSADIIDVLRIEVKDKKNRKFYVIVGEDEIICSIPPGEKDEELYSVLTSLTRIISLALQYGTPYKDILKQLSGSSINKGDIPDLIHRAISKWVNKLHPDYKVTQ